MADLVAREAMKELDRQVGLSSDPRKSSWRSRRAASSNSRSGTERLRAVART